MIRRQALLILAVCLFAAAPAVASAAVLTEGTTTRPFSLSDAGGLLVTTESGGGPSLTVPYTAATVVNGSAIRIGGGAVEFEPRSVRVASDGSYLVAGGKTEVIWRFNADGSVRYLYKASWGGAPDARVAIVPSLGRPFDAFPLPDGGMLVVDRGNTGGYGRVIRLDAGNNVVWQFGGDSDVGPVPRIGQGLVFDPFTAERLPGGHTLISDSLGSRVIEIDDAGTICWSYGTFNVPGPGIGLLIKPHSAQRLTNGNTLICEAEGGRVIEVTPVGQIVWSYGTGTLGSGAGQLNNSNSALRVANGDTVISDSDNGRVFAVDQSGRIVQEYGVLGRIPTGGTIDNPRAVARLADGRTIIADLGNQRLASYGYAPGREYIATSGAIDPSVGAFKTFTKITVNGATPTGTSIAADYSTDGTSWKTLPAGGVLPAGVTGSAIRYRLRLKTSDASVAPSVSDVAIAWDATVPGGTGSGTTSSTPTTPKSTTTTTKSTTTTPKNTTTNLGATTSGSSGSGMGASSVMPGGTTELQSGSSGSGGLGGSAAMSTMSGWVMSETKDDAGWAGVAANKGGPGTVGGLRKSMAPSAAFLLIIYGLGVAWVPGSRMFAQLVIAALPH